MFREVGIECGKTIAMPVVAVGSGLLIKDCIASPMTGGLLGYVRGQFLPSIFGGSFVSHTEKCYNGLVKIFRDLMK